MQLTKQWIKNKNMNKTVTINVSGIVFHINEDAYESLGKYLSAIRTYVSGTPDSAEILTDIEARIAELLQQSLNTSKQVITLEDIDNIRAVMGNPEEFAGEKVQDQAMPASAPPVRKRLFRDPDDKVIGGVCSGLGAYFNIETVWVRLVMVILVFFGGLSIWAYLIMWMIMPLARTVAEKAAMRGESGDINSIISSFREEADDVKNRFSRKGRGSGNGAVLLNSVFNFLVRAFGAMLIVFGCILMAGFLASLLGITLVTENTWVSNWKEALLESPASYIFGIISYVLVAGIPIAMLIYSGVKLMLRLQYSNRWLNTTLGILWLTGLICGLYITGSTLRNFSESAKLRKTDRIALKDTFVVKLNPVAEILRDLDGIKDQDTEEYERQNGFLFRKVNGSMQIVGFAGIYISETDGDSVTVTVNRYSRGSGNVDANTNARSVSYHYIINGNTLLLDQVFLANQPRFRAQDVEVRIGIPRGKTVYFDKNTKYALKDADNTSNVWAGRLAGRRWTMTEDGLACVDCAGLDVGEDDDRPHRRRHKREKHKSNITINDQGIHVEDEDGEVNIDDKGIIITEKK
jgi:phage shock protein PspC (stress-responsive transcriptional regulator)